MADELVPTGKGEVATSGGNPFNRMSGWWKLLIAIGVDVLDFAMVYFLPGFGSIINFFYDIIMTGLAFLMFGFPGLLALWEVIEFTGGIDALIPTFTILVAFIYVPRWLTTKFPWLRKALDQAEKLPVLGKAVDRLWGVDTRKIVERAGRVVDVAQRGVAFADAMPLMEDIESKVALNVQASQQISRQLQDPKQLEEENFRSDLKRVLLLKQRALDSLIKDLDQLEDQDVLFSRRNVRVIKRQKKKFETLKVKVLEFAGYLDRDLEQARRHFMVIKGMLANEGLEAVKVFMAPFKKKAQDVIEDLESKRERPQVEERPVAAK